MRFFLRGTEVHGHGVAADDLVRDAALRITAGEGGVYLYGYCMRQVSPDLVYAKYRRPILKDELAVELRDLGVRMALGRPSYTRDELIGVVPQGERLVAVVLGQTVPRGVPAIPPKNVREVRCAGASLPNARLLDYTGLLEVHAVDVSNPALHGLYLRHVAGGVAPAVLRDPSLAGGEVPARLVAGTVRLKSGDTPLLVPLREVFRTLHASAAAPYVWLDDAGAPCRRLRGAEAKDNPCRGLSCELADGTRIALFEDGGVECEVRFSPEHQDFKSALRGKLNPWVSLVNNRLHYGGPSETDTIALARRVESPLYTDTVFPLYHGAGEYRFDVAYHFPAGTTLPPTVPPALTGAFDIESGTIRYTRCPTPAPLLLRHAKDGVEIIVANLSGMEYVPVAASHLSALVRGAEQGTFPRLQPVPVARSLKIRMETDWEGAAERAGFAVVQRFPKSGTVLHFDGQECFVPDAGAAPHRGWEPSLNASETQAFLTRLAKHVPNAAPAHLVYNARGHVTAVATVAGGAAPCKKTLHSDDYDRFRFVVKTVLPPTLAKEWYDNVKDKKRARVILARTLEGKVAFVDVPDYPQPPYTIAGVVLVSIASRNEFVERLVDEVARWHHLRAFVLSLTQQVGDLLYDAFPDETLE